MLEPLICKCCGGNIDRKTLTCKYCGVEYQVTHDQHKTEVKIVDRPCEVICAEMTIDRRELAYRSNDSNYTDFLVRSLSHSLAEQVVKYMEIDKEFEHDPRKDAYVLRARCRLLRPGYEF